MTGEDSRTGRGAPAPGTGFRDILCVCAAGADNRALLAEAATLAAAAGGKVTALATVEAGSDLDRLARLTGLGTDAARERLVGDTRAWLEAQTAALDARVAVETVVRTGKPFVEIIRRAVEGDHDLVVKAAGSSGPRHRSPFDSTDRHLVRKCPRPVWIHQHDAGRRGDTVMAAIDLDDPEGAGTDTGRVADGLNGRILDVACRVALARGAALCVVHAWDAPVETLAFRWSADSAAVGRYVGEVEAIARRGLSSAVEAARAALGEPERAALPLTTHLVRGPARRVVPDQVAALGAGTLVMGTLSRVGLPGLLIGNTAEDVFDSVECSVVAVKPPGFVSPVAG
ncbi:MAG: universal stress protein [Azospirillaceae bacterium]